MGQVNIEDEVEEAVEEAIEDKENGYTSKKYLISRAAEKFLEKNVATEKSLDNFSSEE
jgi:bifunctional pyridoxal-dependent enzyme with beta-cystathionase and maltose regulon repressor activities